LHGGLDHVLGDVVGQALGQAAQAVGIERIAHRQVHANRQAFHRLEGRLARGPGVLLGVISLVAGRHAAHLVQAGHHHQAAIAELIDLAGQQVLPHGHLATAHSLKGRVLPGHIAQATRHAQHQQLAPSLQQTTPRAATGGEGGLPQEHGRLDKHGAKGLGDGVKAGGHVRAPVDR